MKKPLVSATLLSLIIKRANHMSATLVPPQYPSSWELTPQEIEAKTDAFIAESKQLDDKIASTTEATVDNVVKPSYQFSEANGYLINQLTFLQHVSADKQVRDASTNATQKLEEFDIESSSRHDVFVKFNEVFKTHKETEPEIVKLINKTHQTYVRAGLNLPEAEREKVKEIKKKIANNSLQYSKNLGEQNEYLLFSKEELNGVSDSVLEQFEEVDGKLKMTFKYPDILPVLKNAKNPETRKRAFTGDQNKVASNEVLLLETLKLRDELAATLGFSTYANYNLELKMAKKQEAVFEFLNDLKTKLKPLGEKEVEALKVLKKRDYDEQGLEFDDKYYIWDHRYYDNLYLKENFNVDEEKISEYFPMESTITGMLSIYETLFKLKFVEEKENVQVWHPDVKQFAVWKMDDESKPEFVGWIYLDLHPREGKYGHAANFGLRSSYINKDGERQYPITALVCNFSKPTPSKPSLLKHNEVTTFFHELGHGIHDLVGNNQRSRFNGPGATAWDFVEAPSQMLEYWTWEEAQLKELSSHYKDGSTIPDELTKGLVKSKHVNGALFNLRQLHFALFDMTVHTNKDLANLDVCKLWNTMREEIAVVENGDNVTRGYNSFGHIMTDSYSAGYYGYLWSSVFAADMYHTMFKANPLNSVNGVKYRDIILARGGLYDEKDNLTEFLGREPNSDAFLKELGLN